MINLWRFCSFSDMSGIHLYSQESLLSCRVQVLILFLDLRFWAACSCGIVFFSWCWYRVPGYLLYLVGFFLGPLFGAFFRFVILVHCFSWVAFFYWLFSARFTFVVFFRDCVFVLFFFVGFFGLCSFSAVGFLMVLVSLVLVAFVRRVYNNNQYATMQQINGGVRYAMNVTRAKTFYLLCCIHHATMVSQQSKCQIRGNPIKLYRDRKYRTNI